MIKSEKWIISVVVINIDKYFFFKKDKIMSNKLYSHVSDLAFLGRKSAQW